MNITLAHGAGGRAMRGLVNDLFVSAFDPSPHAAIGLAALDDGAVLRLDGERQLVITTDAHVVSPAFFPGGDIGRLAICGTVNDLAVMGATTPLGITCAIVLEEGYPLADLERIRTSMVEACREAGTTVVAGDTKVMGRGELDGIIITTTGIGLAKRPISDSDLRPGDVIIVTGFIADHGLAVMAQRHKLEFDNPPHSDVAPINHLVDRMLSVAGEGISAMKDPTRGGVASALHEMAAKSKVGIVLQADAIPVTPQARAVSELLGVDPLHVANEGKVVLGVAPEVAPRLLTELHKMHQGLNAAIIGRCTDDHYGTIIIDTGFGMRLLAEAEGELLPRIC
jgi:hydrogenase expression/formation protein HypE